MIPILRRLSIIAPKEKVNITFELRHQTKYQGMKHKNIALEVLKKLLNDEIKIRSKTNLVQSKSLMKMLENSIKK